jgi:hypothetical protein
VEEARQRDSFDIREKYETLLETELHGA